MRIGDISFEGDIQIDSTINTSGSLDISTLLASATVIYATKTGATTFTLPDANTEDGRLLVFKFAHSSNTDIHMDINSADPMDNQLNFGGTLGVVNGHQFQHQDAIVLHAYNGLWNVLRWLSKTTWTAS